MTEPIYSFNKNEFPYSDLTLANPHGLQGGAYFSKLKVLGNTVVFQTPKCKTKNGIIKTDKKIYCDLLFNKDNDDVIEFLEHLEDKIKNLIFEKKDRWFHSDMDMDTIDYHWQNILRPYKGSYVLLRCFIKKPKSTLNSQPTIQIYDEEENILDLEKVTKEKTIVSLLNLSGLKFTSQSFSLEFNLTQVMVLKDTIFRNKCLIKNVKTELSPKSNSTISDNLQENKTITPVLKEKESSEDKVDVSQNSLDENEKLIPMTSKKDILNEDSANESPSDDSVEKNNHNNVNQEQEFEEEENSQDTINENSVENTLEKIDKFDNIENFELNEVKLDIPTDSNLLHLKQPNEVYIEIYKEVKKKAKEAKKRAIEAYLEAKRIKSLYLLDEIESSDDESELLAITKDH